MRYNKFIKTIFILLVFFISIAAISSADLSDVQTDVLSDNGDENSFYNLHNDIDGADSNFTLQSDYGFDNETDGSYSGGINIFNYIQKKTKNGFIWI